MPGFCRQLHSLSCTKGMTLIQCVDDTLSSAVRQLRSLPCTNLKTLFKTRAFMSGHYQTVVQYPIFQRPGYKPVL